MARSRSPVPRRSPLSPDIFWEPLSAEEIRTGPVGFAVRGGHAATHVLQGPDPHVLLARLETAFYKNHVPWLTVSDSNRGFLEEAASSTYLADKVGFVHVAEALAAYRFEVPDDAFTALIGVASMMTGIDRDMSHKDSNFSTLVAEAVSACKEQSDFVHGNEAFCMNICSALDGLPGIYELVPKVRTLRSKTPGVWLLQENSCHVPAMGDFIDLAAIAKSRALRERLLRVSESLLQEWLDKRRLLRDEAGKLAQQITEAQAEDSETVDLSERRLRHAVKESFLIQVTLGCLASALGCRLRTVATLDFLMRCLPDERGRWILPNDGCTQPALIRQLDVDTVPRDAMAEMDGLDLSLPKQPLKADIFEALGSTNSCQDPGKTEDTNRAIAIAEVIATFGQALSQVSRFVAGLWYGAWKPFHRLLMCTAFPESDSLNKLRRRLGQVGNAKWEEETTLEQARAKLQESRVVLSQSQDELDNLKAPASGA
ncbi:hypothetical protein AK812_SmicGene15110 [Symbiodinium microadriaticum]|uniref:Uncharacterized protein n=1 Tax=Symbiodinium microadriaticum TaxID=2951 RepID=A0A1Q9E3S3_SYMMI|nr:hypothetical protein AK812_SmicGene15110 [Symbiodinium microadriaticum]